MTWWFSRTNSPQVSASREHRATEREQGEGLEDGGTGCVCVSLFSVVPLFVSKMQIWFELTPGDVLSQPVLFFLSVL